VPAVIQQSSNVSIAVTTNLGNISFVVTAEFYYENGNNKTQNTEHAYMSGNTTDGSGHDTFNWQCWHIPPGQLKKMTNPRAVFQATATDGTGRSVASQMVTAQVTA